MRPKHVRGRHPRMGDDGLFRQGPPVPARPPGLSTRLISLPKREKAPKTAS
ncbi:hypothetical protein LP419_32550 [Massilia sp. H-1]|nr:hypothetical protein LP419_32550 [Massilia sp. H-1]